jgi:hypothetical protein
MITAERPEAASINNFMRMRMVERLLKERARAPVVYDSTQLSAGYLEAGLPMCDRLEPISSMPQ